MAKPLTREEFEKLLEDENTTDNQILEYVELDENLSEAFEPVFKPREGMIIDEPGLEGAVLLRIFNKRSQKKRQKRYRKKIESGFSGLKIVSEGDSWFQYPLLLDDVIDQLFDRYAILSFGAAGDWLSDIHVEQEYLQAIADEQPSHFLISGGGNDLVGEERLMTMLHPFNPNLAPHQYPNQIFEEFISEIENTYRAMFQKLKQQFPSLTIVCHGYDHAIPDSGKWLGKPMNKISISDPVLQREIIRVVIDRYNDALIDVTREFDNVRYVDCRGVVRSDRWHDELHPKNDGFKDVAERFISAIES